MRRFVWLEHPLFFRGRLRTLYQLRQFMERRRLVTPDGTEVTITEVWRADESLPAPGARSSGDGIDVHVEVEGYPRKAALVRSDLLSLSDREILDYLREAKIV